MLIVSTLLLAVKLLSVQGPSTFPEIGAAYQIDFGSDLQAKAVFISDSEMVYGDLGERGSYTHVTIAKTGPASFAVKWKMNEFVDVEHRYDLESSAVQSRITDCNGRELQLKGTFQKSE
jgi:hypothetical protein